MKILLVLHHEIMGTPGKYRADEMVFWTTSSIKKALDLIRRSGGCNWSWWEIQVQELDSQEDHPKHVGYYGLRGGKLAKPPYDKCLALFKKRPKAWRF
jgi:hypothetical protein